MRSNARGGSFDVRSLCCRTRVGRNPPIWRLAFPGLDRMPGCLCADGWQRTVRQSVRGADCERDFSAPPPFPHWTNSSDAALKTAALHYILGTVLSVTRGHARWGPNQLRVLTDMLPLMINSAPLWNLHTSIAPLWNLDSLIAGAALRKHLNERSHFIEKWDRPQFG